MYKKKSYCFEELESVRLEKGCYSKAAGLRKLLQVGFRIPQTIIVSICFKQFSTVQLNVNEVEEILSSFLEDTDRYIIRSNATNEDSENLTFTGAYDSVVVGSNASDVAGGIIHVLRNMRRKSYLWNKIEPSCHSLHELSCLIQPFKESSISGVCEYTNNPLGEIRLEFASVSRGITDASKEAVHLTLSSNWSTNIQYLESYFSDSNLASVVTEMLFEHNRKIDVPNEYKTLTEWLITKEYKLYYLQYKERAVNVGTYSS